MACEGVTDIVIEAPTGAGKSAVGAACCYWAATWPTIYVGDGVTSREGGYYLVTQLLLQDQITRDVRENFSIKDFASLKSADSYECDGYGKCNIGLQVTKEQCEGKKEGCCPYLRTKGAFEKANFSVTNYPYFLTERMFVGKFPIRNVLICDECHTLERTLLRFGEVVLTQKLFKDLEIRGVELPEHEELEHFLKWMEERYLPVLEDRAKALKTYMENDPAASKNESLQKRYTALSNQAQRVKNAILDARSHPEDWVYWTDENEKDGRSANLKPLNAAPYMDWIKGCGVVRVYMSAYPGSKDIFCKSLGLDKDSVAWLKLKSTFDPANRQVVMAMIGSMSKRNKAKTLPVLFRSVDRVLNHHHDQKGIIHCNSYVIGQEIVDFLMKSPHAPRILFPKNADERTPLMEKHTASKEPTVLVSPSMTEGFDFKFDLAKWQIIAKMPYPYLGDMQVARKKDLDPDWYALQTAMTIIQACGRIVRDEKDDGVTYILDSDFSMLWDRHKSFFPKWFQDAMVWPSGK
jgi:Rad3-related DNA helicase